MRLEKLGFPVTPKPQQPYFHRKCHKKSHAREDQCENAEYRPWFMQSQEYTGKLND